MVAFVVVAGILIHANQSPGGASRAIDVTVTGAKSMSPSEPRVDSHSMTSTALGELVVS